MTTISILPVEGDNIITAAELAATGPPDFVGAINKAPAPSSVYLRITDATSGGTVAYIGASGGSGWLVPWVQSATAPDGVYTATVTAANLTPIPSARENFILAAHNTPFEVVGLAFINVSTQLASVPVYTGNTYASLSAERAGLTILAADAYPKQQIANLLKDVAKEIKLLDFVPSAPSAIVPTATVDKIEAIQTTVAAYVAHQPALVALMPDHTGW